MSPDSTCIALGTSANTYLLDPATLTSWKELDATRSAFAMAYSPNGQVFAAAGRESIVYLYYLPSYSLSTTGKGHKTGNVYGMCFSPSSDLLITGADDNAVILWEVEHLRMLRALNGHTSWIYSVVFINDEQFASASADHTIRFWNSRANTALSVEEDEHTATVRALAMLGPCIMYLIADFHCRSPNGIWMGSASADKTVKIFYTGWCDDVREIL